MEAKHVFVERHGDPARFLFKGQCYDAGHQSNTKPCAVCGRDIRFCYILKAEEVQFRSTPTSKITIGSCCFSFFPLLTEKLKAAKTWLMTTVVGGEEDVKVQQQRIVVVDKMEQWRTVKRQALEKIRTYRKQTGTPWLPKDLFEIQSVISKTVPKYKRASSLVKFYQRQTLALEEKLNK